MSSKLLESYGIDPLYIMIGMATLILILFILVIFSFIKISRMNKRYELFMKGKSPRSLEKIFLSRINKLDEVEKIERENRGDIDRLISNEIHSFQKYGLVKYNAFQDMGGRLSFALALLNDQDDGVVINAIHTREGCYTYVKEIIRGRSVLLLSEEEKEAVTVALNK
jgi:hypothetical protein